MLSDRLETDSFLKFSCPSRVVMLMSSKKAATGCCELFKSAILVEVGKLEKADTEGQDFAKIKKTIKDLPCLCKSKGTRPPSQFLSHVKKCRNEGEPWIAAVKRCAASYAKQGTMSKGGQEEFQ